MTVNKLLIKPTGGGRNYAIDLLRILSMFMIVMLHSGSHGNTLAIGKGINTCSIVFHFIEALSICSVNVFVLISGYFLCTQRFKLSRMLKMVFVVWFYSVAWFFISVYLLKEFSFSIQGFVSAVFPISYSQYWFISAYIGMCLFSPIINIFLSNINRIQHIGTIVILVAVFSVWPDIMLYSNPMGVGSRGYTVVWFVILYIVAAYLRKYPVIISKRKAFVFYFASALVLLLIWLIIALVVSADNFEDEVHNMPTFYYYRYNSFIVLAMSVFLWLLFSNMNIVNNKIQKIIAFAAPLTMGIYLIHDNERARAFVWQGLQGLEPSWSAPLIVLGYVVMIFLTCLIIEWVRVLMFSVINKRSWYKKIMEKCDMIPVKSKIYIENHLI